MKELYFVSILICHVEEYHILHATPFYSVPHPKSSYLLCIIWVSALLSGLYALFFFFRASPMAYGTSQTRGPIGAAAAGLRHSHSNSGS